MLSINTNNAAMAALKVLSSTNSSLSNTENRVSTGLKVSSALDDGATFAVAQGLRQKITAFDGVNASLGNASSLLSVANTAATNMSDVMSKLQSTLVSLSDNSLTTDQRAIYSDNVSSMLSQLNTFVNAANYNGSNLLSAATNVTFVSDTTGSAFAVRGHGVATALATMSTAIYGASITAASAQGELATGGAIAIMNSALNTALGQIGADNTSAKYLQSLNTDLQSAITAGLGTTVDADLSKESANLTALQTKQQLAVQALSIANSSSSIILSLFR